MMAKLTSKVSIAKVLLPCISHISTAPVSRRSHMITFPDRPPIEQRYLGLEAIKSMSIPSKDIPVNAPQEISPQQRLAFASSPMHSLLEEDYVKPNGISVVFAQTLPNKYKRSVISEEEIDYINRGGREN